MRELPATLLRGTARRVPTIVESLFSKASDVAAIQLVNGQRIKHMQEQLFLKQASVPQASKRGLLLLLALLIGLAIGGGFWFRKQLLNDQLPDSFSRKRGPLLFLALLIGSGVGAGLWLRKRLRDEPVSSARKPDVSVVVVFTGASIIPQFEPAVQSSAAMSLPPPTIVSQDEPGIQHDVAPSFPNRLSVEQPSVARAERTPVSLATKRGVLLLLAFLIVLVIGGGGLWFGLLSRPAGHTSQTAARKPTVLSSTRTTPAVPVTSPIQAKTYDGRIYDVAGNVNTSMSLTKFQQNQGKISGYLTLGPKLHGGGAFSGNSDSTNHFHFTVVDAAGQATLFFSGIVQSATTLSGDYYSCREAQGSKCLQTSAEYGIWSVVLAS